MRGVEPRVSRPRTERISVLPHPALQLRHQGSNPDLSVNSRAWHASYTMPESGPPRSPVIPRLGRLHEVPGQMFPCQRTWGTHELFKLGNQASNLEQQLQRLPCCQLHHSRSRTPERIRTSTNWLRASHACRYITGAQYAPRESNPAELIKSQSCDHYIRGAQELRVGVEPTVSCLQGRRIAGNACEARTPGVLPLHHGPRRKAG